MQEFNKNLLALKAANLYYVRGDTMAVIAQGMGLSRSTISRLLRYARDTEMVKITLNLPTWDADALSRAIRSEFGIAVHVVPVVANATELERLELVARKAVHTLNSIYGANMTLGIAWGTTIAAVARHLSYKATAGAQIVQLNGAANPGTTGLQYAADIIERFGQAYNASVQPFPVPAFFDYAATRDAMWKERSIRRILAMQRNADVSLFSLGAVAGGIPSHVYSAGYLDQRDFHTLKAENVVGDISTVFIRANGTSQGISLNDRASGLPPEELRHVGRRICVVSGHNKLPAIQAALRARLVTDLIIDESTATKLVTPAAYSLAAERLLGEP